jgi:predicted YcjX-like family ATPase
VRLSDLSETTADALRNAGAMLLDLMTPTLRLGVTGLARSGKTVFITALVRSLVAGGRLPFFAAMAEGRVTRAYLEPQPDDAVPRFAYEEHLAKLASDPPQWPESTKRISQLRVTIEYAHTSALRRALGPGRLHVDIVDYPGEWLIDLPLWRCPLPTGRAGRSRTRAPHIGPSRQGLAAVPLHPRSRRGGHEQAALTGAGLFTRYLQAARTPDPELTAPGPGRFLLPGDLAGSPLLTFFPLPPAASSAYQRGSLGAMLARRFESYKAHVVKPFFRDHFARLDRQIVLIDALAGRQRRRRRARSTCSAPWRPVLKCFRPAPTPGSPASCAGRIDRLLFAATKADHLHHTSHDRLEAILRLIADKAIARAAFAGADVKADGARRAAGHPRGGGQIGRQRLPCIVGVPLPGERLGGNGCSTARPRRPYSRAICRRTRRACWPNRRTAADSVHFLRFRPPRVSLESPSGEEPALAAHPPRPGRRVPAGGPPHMSEPRKPRAFDPGDPAIVEEPPASAEPDADAQATAPPDGNRTVRPTLADLGQRGLRWGMVLASALAGAALLGSAPGSRASSPPPWCARTGSAGPRWLLLLVAALPR